MNPGPARGDQTPDRAAAGARAFPVVRALALAACVAAWITFRLGTSICLEDALITFRYAENIGRGVGFVFNPGERVLATTSPLMTLLLAVPGAVFGAAAIPVAAVVLGVVAALAGLLFLDSALAGCGVRPWLRIAGILAAGLHPDIIWSTVGGLETPLVLCFMAMSLDGMVRGRWRQAAVASALAVLARPDALVWAGVVALVAVVRRRRSALGPALVGLGLLVPWLAFAWAYFGSPVPHSVIAKQVIQPALDVNYAMWVLRSLWIPAAVPLENALWWCLAGFGTAAVIGSRRLRPLIAPALFIPLFGAAYWLGRAPYFEWYMIPVTWCSIVLGIAGSDALAGPRVDAQRRPAPREAMVAALWILQLLATARWEPETFRHHRANQRNEVGLRRRAGEWLRANTREDAVVAMEAIGYQGTTAHRRIIDLGGLISPAVVRIHRETGTNAETFDRVLTELEPDALVLRSVEADENVHFQGGRLFDTEEQFGRFRARYAEAVRMTAPDSVLWGRVARLTIYLRRPG
jgi:hypothetical protein